jgi:hypothetical protein
MAVTLETTLTDRYANSYVTVDYCDDYWESHYNTTLAEQWAGLSTAQKTLLLIKACRVIETGRFTANAKGNEEYQLYYDRSTRTVLFLDREALPIKYAYYQSLQFPRNLDRDPTSGDLYIPEPVKMAQCEQALYTLNFDESAVASRMQGIADETTTVGSIRVHQRFSMGGTEWSPSAIEYLKPFFLKLSHSAKRQ